MPVVINEFEVVPEPPRRDDRQAEKKGEKSSKQEQLTDYEVKKMIERRTERLERVSVH